MITMLRVIARWLFGRRSKITIRQWNSADIRAIVDIEQEDDGPIDGPTFFDWIVNEADVYGIVAVENGTVRGFAVAHPESAYIHTLRVKKSNRRGRIGTRLLQHFLISMPVWRKERLSIDVSEKNTAGRRFLERNRFAVVMATEYHDADDVPQETFLTLHHPPPLGFTWEDIVVINGDESICL